MLKRILLTLILGATVSAYLQAGTGVVANATAAASAADMKSNAADANSSAAGLQLMVPPDIISPDNCDLFLRFTEDDCKRIIEWLKEAPENRKNASVKRGGRILKALLGIRFHEELEMGAWQYNKSPAIQPALDFLLSLKPHTVSKVRRYTSFNGVLDSSDFDLLSMASSACNNQKDQADFLKFAQQITRLMFLNGRNLKQIEDDAAYLLSEYDKQLIKTGRNPTGSWAYLPNTIVAFRNAFAEVEAIRQEAARRLMLNSPNLVFLPGVLRNVVADYDTELTFDEAWRALTELSAPQPQQSAK